MVVHGQHRWKLVRRLPQSVFHGGCACNRYVALPRLTGEGNASTQSLCHITRAGCCLLTNTPSFGAVLRHLFNRSRTSLYRAKPPEDGRHSSKCADVKST